jgi:hypothetical protein
VEGSRRARTLYSGLEFLSVLSGRNTCTILQIGNNSVSSDKIVSVILEPEAAHHGFLSINHLNHSP